jgi:molecular chaperone GrpE (heat shock protein)
LRLQLTELEEKHVIIRKNLNSDENTVIMFANDLIKRMDLIDKLTERYINKDNTVADQLRGLKTSLEDLLNQHGVSPFEMSPGTEVDGTISAQINIIEGIPGERKTRITKVMRPGFRYRCANGASETILRKVEVNTSSQ